MQEAPAKNTSHFPTFRLRVAEQMADYRERLAERLVHEREKKSFSQDTLALRAGVSPKTIKRIEEKKVDAPRPVTIRRLAEALEIDPDHLRPPAELEAEQLSRIEEEISATKEAVLALRKEVVSMRTKLLAEIGQVRTAQADQPRTRRRSARGSAGSNT